MDIPKKIEKRKRLFLSLNLTIYPSPSLTSFPPPLSPLPLSPYLCLPLSLSNLHCAARSTNVQVLCTHTITGSLSHACTCICKLKGFVTSKNHWDTSITQTYTQLPIELSLSHTHTVLSYMTLIGRRVHGMYAHQLSSNTCNRPWPHFITSCDLPYDHLFSIIP